MTKKRPRKVGTVDVELVEVLEDLAHIDEDIRLAAAHRLLTKFIQPRSNDGHKLVFILRKLMRGICSGRKAARLGFSVALTESLDCCTRLCRNGHDPDFNFEMIFDVLRDATAANSGLSKQEQRDHYLGQLFAAEAVLRSSICFQDPDDINPWLQVLDFIFDLSSRKPWLRQECGFLLISVVDQRLLPPKHPLYCETLMKKYEACNSIKTPEGVALWLAVKSLCPSANLPGGAWMNDDPLSSDAKHQLQLALADAPSAAPPEYEAHELKPSGRWSPVLHFAWWRVISEILNSRKRRINFDEFWSACVNDVHFASNSSLERKSTGFALLRTCVLKVPKSFLATLFTSDILRCLVNHLSPAHDRYLHDAAQTVCDAILHRGGDPSSGLMMLESLWLTGYANFDERTKTKTTARLAAQIARLQPVGLALSFGNAFAKVCSDSKDDRNYEAKSLVEHAVAIVKSAPSEEFKTHSFTAYIRRLLSLLAAYAYHGLETIDPASGRKMCITIPDKTRSVFRSGIASCLARIIPQHQYALDIVQSLISDIIHLSASEMSKCLVLSVDGEIRKLIDDIQKILETFQSQLQAGNNSSIAYAGSLLLGICLIQVYNEDLDSVHTLADLARVFGAEEESVPGEHTLDSNGFIECLLTLESRQSLLLRRTCCLAFQYVTHTIDHKGLEPLLKVLRAEETPAGQAELLETLDEDAASSDAEDSEVMNSPHGSNLSVEYQAEYQASIGSESTATTSPPCSETDDEHEDDPELAAFDMKVAQALQSTAKIAALDHQVSDDSNDEDMDDEDMEALDSSLTAIFQERKKITDQRKERRHAIASVQDFKLRCLELLAIFVDKQYSNILCVSLLEPILSLIRSTKNPQIAGKGSEIIKKYTTSCKASGLPSFDANERLWQALMAVHAEARLKGSTQHGHACSQASLLLVRFLVFGKTGSEELRPIIDSYSDMQQRALTDAECHVHSTFFKDWLNWCSSMRDGGQLRMA